jgi:hypothetical protein
MSYEHIQRDYLRRLLRAVYKQDREPDHAADVLIHLINENYDLKKERVCEYCLKTDCKCGHLDDMKALDKDGGLPF